MPIHLLVFSWTIVVLNILNILTILIMIFFERRDSKTIQAWILAFLLLPPGISLYIYFVFGCGPKLNRKKIDLRRSTINKQINLTNNLDQITLDENLNNSIIKFNCLHNNSPLTQYNKVNIFNNAYEKFETLLEDIQNAQHSIHILYYIIRSDTIGNLFIDKLTEKALQGVKVKLIYDDAGCIKTPKRIFDKLKKAGGEVHSFFPSHLKFINLNLNYRNHKKLVIIDGKIGYVGGINIGDEYMSLNKKLSPWKDCHLKIVGDAVNYLQLQFIQDMTYVSDYKIENEVNFKKDYFPKSTCKEKTFVQIVESGPDKKTNENIKASYLRMIYNAKNEIYIQTPYVALDDSFLSALISTAKYGVKIHIMLPKIYDNRAVYRVTTSYIEQLMDAGINLYLYDGFIHSKVIFIDDCITSIGTCNFNIRSFSINFEVNAFITDSTIAQKMKSIFLKDLKICTKLNKDYIKSKTILTKLEESFWRLFLPIL